MTHPQDPEQQAAVVAWLESIGAYREYPEIPVTAALWRHDDFPGGITLSQATFFYRTHQAQVAEAQYNALAEVKEQLVALDDVDATKSIVSSHMAKYRAQLNPQKPKEKETS